MTEKEQEAPHNMRTETENTGNMKYGQSLKKMEVISGKRMKWLCCAVKEVKD
jgi:hypothetical protein